MNHEDFEFLFGLGVIAVIITLILVGANYFGGYQCKEQAIIMKVNHNYSFTTGCMVEVDEKWVPIDAVRVIK